MPKKQKNSILSALNTLLVIAGIASLIVGTQDAMQANVLPHSGQGAIAGQPAPSGEQFLTQGISLHPAAAVIPNMSPILALGMLLIMLGCSIHALFVLKNQKPTTVGLRRKVDGNDLNPIRQYLEIFWVSRRK